MTEILERQISRGDLYYADLRPVVGCEQGGVRPVLVIQNDVGNQHSPTVIAAAITGRKGKHRIPTHVEIRGECCGLQVNSLILLEQIRTLDRKRLRMPRWPGYGGSGSGTYYQFRHFYEGNKGRTERNRVCGSLEI